MVSAGGAFSKSPIDVVNAFRRDLRHGFSLRNEVFEEWLERADFVDEFGEYLLVTSAGHKVVQAQFDEVAAVMFKLKFPDVKEDTDEVVVHNISISPERDLVLHPFQRE